VKSRKRRVQVDFGASFWETGPGDPSHSIPLIELICMPRVPGYQFLLTREERTEYRQRGRISREMVYRRNRGVQPADLEGEIKAYLKMHLIEESTETDGAVWYRLLSWSEQMFRTLGPPTQLYRHYDSSGQLLYVGISLSALWRTMTHRRDSAWWNEVTVVKIENHRNRWRAIEAERQAIVEERPRYNIRHSEEK